MLNNWLAMEIRMLIKTRNGWNGVASVCVAFTGIWLVTLTAMVLAG